MVSFLCNKIVLEKVVMVTVVVVTVVVVHNYEACMMLMAYTFSQFTRSCRKSANM